MVSERAVRDGLEQSRGDERGTGDGEPEPICEVDNNQFQHVGENATASPGSESLDFETSTGVLFTTQIPSMLKT